MSHPDPNGAPDRRPIKVGEVCENPVTGERSVILERPWDNPASRVTGALTALVGARVMGEHPHPALVKQFTVLEGALSIKYLVDEMGFERAHPSTSKVPLGRFYVRNPQAHSHWAFGRQEMIQKPRAIWTS